MGVHVPVVLVLVAVALAYGPVQAQHPASADEVQTAGAEDVAKGLFVAGKAAYEAGNYDRALQYFEEAYQHSKRPELLYNIGVAADHLRYNRAAIEAFKAYIRELPAAENRIEVENRIRALEAVVEREKTAPALFPSTARAPHPRSSVDASLDANAPARKDESVFSKWWFWTAAGGVLAAVVVGVAVATSGDKVGKATPGSDGVVVLTLSRQ